MSDFENWLVEEGKNVTACGMDYAESYRALKLHTLNFTDGLKCEIDEIEDYCNTLQFAIGGKYHCVENVASLAGDAIVKVIQTMRKDIEELRQIAEN